MSNRYESESVPSDRAQVKKYNKFIGKIRKRQLKHLQKDDQRSSSKKLKINKDGENNVQEQFVSQVEVSKSTTNFTIIGGHDFRNDKEINPVLSKWLSQPKLISNNLSETMCEVPKFSDKVSLNLDVNNIKHFFPVQQVFMHWQMKEHNKKNYLNKYLPPDACISSPTGSGKTIAYVLPIVQSLICRLVPRIRCLVVVPVQELVDQVANVFLSFTKGTSLKVEGFSGGKVPLKLEQNRLLKKIPGSDIGYECLVDILVITPGRLVEHLQVTSGFDLTGLKFLVLDEADRVLDRNQNDWLFYLQKHLGHEKFASLSLNSLKKKHPYQKLLFSATLLEESEKLKKLNLFQPVLFAAKNVIDKKRNINSQDDKDGTNKVFETFLMPQELEEWFIMIDSFMKPLVISELLTVSKWRMVLCFCKSAKETHRLAQLLSLLCPTLKIRDISSQLGTSKRNEVLSQFSNGEIDMLVCSDMMARGIDIPKVRYVISYDPPKYMHAYVHRAGRTGRAGVKGTVLTLTAPNQVLPLIQKLKDDGQIAEFKMEFDRFQDRVADFKKALRTLKESMVSSKNSIPEKKSMIKIKRRTKKRQIDSPIK